MVSACTLIATISGHSRCNFSGHVSINGVRIVDIVEITKIRPFICEISVPDGKINWRGEESLNGRIVEVVKSYLDVDIGTESCKINNSHNERTSLVNTVSISNTFGAGLTTIVRDSTDEARNDISITNAKVPKIKTIKREFNIRISGTGNTNVEIDEQRVDCCSLSGEYVDGVESDGID